MKPFHRRLFKGNPFGKGTLQFPRHDADVFRDAEEVAEGETDEFDVVFLDKGKHFGNGVVHRLLSRSFLWRRHGAGHTLYLFYHISRPSGKGYFPTLGRPGHLCYLYTKLPSETAGLPTASGREMVTKNGRNGIRGCGIIYPSADLKRVSNMSGTGGFILKATGWAAAALWIKRGCVVIGAGIGAVLLWVIIGSLVIAAHYPSVSDPSSIPAASGFYGEEGEVTNDRVMLVEHNWDALIHRLRLIEGAKERIILSTFDFHDDDSGQDVMAALVAAAERGVEIQIITDGLTGLLRMGGNDHFSGAGQLRKR